MRKPKEITLYDGEAKCVSESLYWNEAFGVEIDSFLYTSKDVRRLQKWLVRAEKWIRNKELYKGKGIK